MLKTLNTTMGVWNLIDGTMDNTRSVACTSGDSGADALEQAASAVREAGWAQIPAEAFGPGKDQARPAAGSLDLRQWQFVVDQLRRWAPHQRDDLTETEEAVACSAR